MAGNRWLEQVERNPGHSAWYIERFRAMERAGDDIVGEARLIDAMVARGSRVLDAGCGPGRTGGYLARQGHTVVGVDIDPALIAAAAEDYPEATWVVADLSKLDLPGAGIAERFDIAVCAGNVMTFLDPATRQATLEHIAAHLRASGRLVIGFGAGRDYSFDDFFADVDQAHLRRDYLFSTWDLRPFDDASDFLVAVLSRH